MKIVGLVCIAIVLLRGGYANATPVTLGYICLRQQHQRVVR